MELSRWGFAKLTRISDRYRDLQQFLTEVLEGDRSLIGETRTEMPSAFTVRDDVESLLHEATSRKSSYLPYLQSNREAKFEGTCFLKLSPFFEAGFMLQTSSSIETRDTAKLNLVSLQSMFLFGKVFLPHANQAPNLELSLPTFLQDHVYCGRIEPVLRAFGLEALTNLKSAGAFAFSPRDGLVFLLICNRPHPWQVSALETSYLSCRSILHLGQVRRGENG